jgi:hypothetical protein
LARYLKSLATPGLIIDLLKAGFFYSGSKQHEDLQWLGNFTKSIEDLDRQMVTS